jgi:hypothetical protein
VIVATRAKVSTRPSATPRNVDDSLPERATRSDMHRFMPPNAGPTLLMDHPRIAHFDALLNPMQHS